MKTLNNLHALEVTYGSPTEQRGARVKIKSHRFKQSKIISFNYEYNQTYEMAQNWLENNGFDLVGQAEGNNSYIILSTTFKPLK